MEAAVNNAFLESRRKLAKWGNYIGLGALIAGLFTVARSPVLSSTLLLIGVCGASIGAYMANRYIREPRVDQVLSRALDGLDKRYTLYSYYLPAGQVVLSHFGFTVLEARSQGGQIAYSRGRWSHKARLNLLKQILGEPSLGSPDKDLAIQIEHLRKWMARQGLDDVPVSGAIVFTNQEAGLEIEGLGFPAVRLRELAPLLKGGVSDQVPLATSQRREIESKLDELVQKA
ncbi:MAG: NAD(P)(+) transhydrogenase (Re/Si-specific) subunit beta [Chloroflexi bacterium]|nr:NAD(P)(+) transhydrogenase (Re/Si-specific) subunit beta [Chloroflexota bacterium]